MTTDIHELGKIRWMCRRGMLELDLFLLDFFDQAYTLLSAEEKRIFLDLLNEPDPDLYQWLLAKSVPEKTEFAQMITKIRDHKANASPK